MEKLNVAILGCGRIAVCYQNAFEKLIDEINVVYAVDKDIRKAAAFASCFEGCHTATDLEDILDKDIDVLHICLPHYLHASAAIKAMKAGIHVLVEKPVALTLTDAKRMITTEWECQVKAGVIFQTRYVSGIEVIKNLVTSGKLGRILGAKSLLTWSRQPDYYQGSDWKGTWEKEGGGVLIDQAIHSIDRVRYLVGEEVEWINGSIHNYWHHFVNVEDTASAVVGFHGGCIYNLYASNVYQNDSPITLEIWGERGRAGMIQDMGYYEIDGSYTEIHNTYEDVTVGPDYWGSAHHMQIKQFYRAVREDIPVKIDLTEGKKTLEIVKGIYKSSAVGGKITLPFEDEVIAGI